MTITPEARNPELDSVTLKLVDVGGDLKTFTEYSYNENFLTPTDGFSFTIADDGNEFDSWVVDQIKIGSEVALYVNDKIQASGYVDAFEIRNSRSGGTVVTIEGRDKLSTAVDGHIDPRIKFKESDTLLQILERVFGEFGFSVFTETNEANRNIITGAVRGLKASKKGRELKSFRAAQLKPFPQEGAFAFASRISQRFGLWIWLASDGKTVVVSKPDFDQEPRYRLQRKRGAASSQNNILEGGARYDGTDQPTILYAFSQGGGGEFEKAKLRFGQRNPVCTAPNVEDIIKRYPDVPVKGAVGSFAFNNKRARPLFLQDDESKTQEQLEYFAQREMSLHARKALVCHYEVAGHTCNGQPWCVDTIVDVDDDIARVDGTMWIQSRAFSKSRSGGTKTSLELIRRGSLIF